MKKVEDMTVGEILESGAKISISFYDEKTKEDAKVKLAPYLEVHAIQEHSVMGEFGNQVNWLDVEDFKRGISVNAFHEEEKE